MRSLLKASITLSRGDLPKNIPEVDPVRKDSEVGVEISNNMRRTSEASGLKKILTDEMQTKELNKIGI